MSNIKSKPKPYQEEAHRIYQRSPRGAVAAHGVGTGKTFTSIMATHQNKGPVVAVVPASLVNNYEKELKKHLGKVPENIRVMSYEKFMKMGEVQPNTTVVIDEAHRLRSTKSGRYRSFKANQKNIDKALLLTASLIYNQPSDLAGPINLVAGEEVLPEDPKEFAKKYIKEDKIRPGIFDALRGIKPGIERGIKNKKSLEKALKGRVHFYENPKGTEDFPEQSVKDYEVEMGPKQYKYYKFVLDKLPWYMRRKIRKGLPPSKQESENLNAFLSGTRQVSNTPLSYMRTTSPAVGARMSPKIQTMVKHLTKGLKSNPRHKALVYSNYLKSGLKPYAAVLEQKGIPYAFFTGKESKKQKEKIMRDYNTGNIPVMLVSSAGAEGLDTKGTRSIQIMEPHWNEEKIKQIVGRGNRYQSHAHLPPEERKVTVRRYHAIPPQPKTFLGRTVQTLFNRPAKKGVDQYLYNMAKEKDKLNQQFWDVVRKAGTAND